MSLLWTKAKTEESQRTVLMEKFVKWREFQPKQKRHKKPELCGACRHLSPDDFRIFDCRLAF